MQILEFSNKFLKRANTTYSSLGFTRSRSNTVFVNISSKPYLWLMTLGAIFIRSTFIRWRWGLTFFSSIFFWSHPCWRDWPVLIFWIHFDVSCLQVCWLSSWPHSMSSIHQHGKEYCLSWKPLFWETAEWQKWWVIEVRYDRGVSPLTNSPVLVIKLIIKLIIL